MAEKPVRDAVAAALRRVDGLVLGVRRPDEPGEELPNIWGLPAITLLEGESPEDGIRRLGALKLDVELTPLHVLAEGEQERAEYVLHMTVYEATPGGEPTLPRREPGPDVTMYDDADWLPIESFNKAADKGSLCCRLFLDAAGPNQTKPLVGPPEEPITGPPAGEGEPEEQA